MVTLDGQLQGGRFHGKGKFIYNGGGTYDGHYKHGEFHGEGTRVFSNGSVYSGNFVSGMQEGEGMLHKANNDQYVGMWYRDLPEGRGVLMYGHGDRSAGLPAVVCLWARAAWSDGGFYEGQYQDKGRQKASKSSGLRNGYGIRWWVSVICTKASGSTTRCAVLVNLLPLIMGLPTLVPSRTTQAWQGETWGNQLGMTTAAAWASSIKVGVLSV